MPSPAMAGLMAAAILSDTVMFKSPTCTKRDVAMAERMARIANVSLNELGKLLFDGSFDGKSAEELLHSDFKEFHIAEQNLGVGQITCLDSEDMLQRREEFLEAMRHDQTEHHYAVCGQRRRHPQCLLRRAQGQQPVPAQGHEPEKADHPHAHRPLGLISPHFTQGQAPACPCFSLHIVLY